MSNLQDRPPNRLCGCPCHMDNLECHSCYVVACTTIILEHEIDERLSR